MDWLAYFIFRRLFYCTSSSVDLMRTGRTGTSSVSSPTVGDRAGGSDRGARTGRERPGDRSPRLENRRA